MKSRFVRAVTSTVSVALLAACGGFTGTPDTTPLTGSSGERVLVPAGYGTLAQDEFTLTLQSGPLQAKVTPLAESVIRLAAGYLRAPGRNRGIRQDVPTLRL